MFYVLHQALGSSIATGSDFLLTYAYIPTILPGWEWTMDALIALSSVALLFGLEAEDFEDPCMSSYTDFNAAGSRGQPVNCRASCCC